MKKNLEFKKRMKRNLELKKSTCYNSKEIPLALMHLWHLSTTPSFWDEYFAERL